jgi:hypothetical protein
LATLSPSPLGAYLVPPVPYFPHHLTHLKKVT